MGSWKNVIDIVLFHAALARCMKIGTQREDARWPKHQWILGHRGARRLAPENTLSSFRLALEYGADGVEFDVLLSRDGIPVVIHDDTLVRTTNGQGRVCDLAYAELALLDATKLVAGFAKEGIPSLLATLESLPDNVLVNIELKNSGRFSNAEFVERVLSDIRAHETRLRILVSSFDSELLCRLRAKNVGFLIAQLLCVREEHFRRALSNLPSTKPDALNLSPDLATPLARMLARKAHLRMGLWTINDIVQAQRWFRLGIDGIFTDRVPEIVGALRN